MDICSALNRIIAGKIVLDMGCGRASSFPYLYHCFNIKSYTGVDNKSIKVLFSDQYDCLNETGFKKAIKKDTIQEFNSDDPNDFYSLYKITSQKAIKTNNILSKVEFSKSFKYHSFGARCFLRKNKRVFDFIILSNFLHLFSCGYAKKLYNSCRNIIANNGFIYIEVANDKHSLNETVRWGLNQSELLAFIEPIQNNPMINNFDKNISILFQV